MGGETGAHESGSKSELILSVPSLRAECRQQAQSGWDSGVTVRMLVATDEYKKCLVGIIDQLVETYYQDGSDIPQRIEELSKRFSKLYWDIYCRVDDPKFCGTLYSVVAAGNAVRIIEDILAQMEKTILELIQ